jgi:hypothetical protein
MTTRRTSPERLRFSSAGSAGARIGGVFERFDLLSVRARRKVESFVRRVLKRVALILAIAFVAAQFVRPARTNPSFASAQSVENIVRVPPDVHATLMRACGDCHSDQTEWPWYSHVAPVSWFVINHVNQGRKRINFSNWVRPGNEPVDSIDRLKAMRREVRNGGMPLTSYTLIHWSASLSPEEVKRICEWSEEEQQRLGGAVPGK